VTVVVWLLVRCVLLGGLVGAHGAGGTEGRQLGGAFLLALVLWGGIGLLFATYIFLAGTG
jgi:hypothetical protein